MTSDKKSACSDAYSSGLMHKRVPSAIQEEFGLEKIEIAQCREMIKSCEVTGN